ncbi:VCBS domain-containing protein [Yoonia litorea]|uniref:VCBS repeat-containing protein n=1 Tax=Yoonia litorea TaxID=1123755 RepID=A0A1I6N3K1_9RHOB|nr:VCBS domain-containing protein [Yoonia litorea]SFS22523.1 VCBS repeat-containing protein [Yoonia litorea]
MANAYFTSDAGTSVTGLDLNNDGIADIVQSDAFTDAGSVSVIYGSTEGFDASVDLDALTSIDGFTLTGTDAGDEFGYVLAGANDLLDKGQDALLIGERATGEVHVVFAGDTTTTFTVTGLPVLADGMSLTALGDFNGDGIGDFAIGAPDAGDGLTFPGEVYVIYGSADLSGTTLDVSTLDGTNGFVINGFEQDASAGTAVAGAGDLNGDGFADLIIGAPDTDDGFNTGAGAAYIVYGSGTVGATEDISTTSLDVTTFTGLGPGDAFGSAVDGGSDVNGDGEADVIISAPLSDPNGTNSGAAFVFFSTQPTDGLDVNSLDGTNGFAIEGLSNGDELGADVALLGDVSGDGIGDIGVLTRSGDLYIIYGTTTDTGGSVDLSTLGTNGGADGVVFTNLFEGDANTQVTLTPLGDINDDAGISINDIGISATGLGGTPLAAINILGGTENFAAMQSAAGSSGGTIDFSAISGDVPFVGTDVGFTITGARATMTEDDPSVQGTLVITPTGSDPVPNFSSDSVQGALGLFVISSNVWTYTLDASSVTALQALDAGDIVLDRAVLTADDGTKKEINVTINGVDDPAFLSLGAGLSVAGNIARTAGSIALTDVDEDDAPTFPAVALQGTYGKLLIDDGGTYTYVITNPAVTTLSGGSTFTDTFDVTASDGSVHQVTVTLGAPVTLDFDDNANEIFTSFADDTINAFGGDDTINAGAGDDTVNAGEGDDSVTDALGDDTVNGGNGNDTIVLMAGNNTVNGGAGADFITTGFQNDTINAGAGNDVIKAEGDGGFLFGNNRITGAEGDDTMMGGAGVDTFVFGTNDGSDTIGKIISVTETPTGFDAIVSGRDFQAGIDEIELVGFTTATQTAVTEALNGTANGTLSSSGLDTVFNAEGTQITLVGVALSTLEESDFIFA